MLGAELDKVLRNGELQVLFENNSFFIAYYDNRYPVAFESYRLILKEVAALLPIPEQAPLDILSRECESLAGASGYVGSEFDKIKAAFAELLVSSLRLGRALENVLQSVNGLADGANSISLRSLLEAQHYRLTFWKTGLEEINYRRFFDVSSLVCLNVQNPATFDAAHQFLACLLQAGAVTGVRVDHPDGLWDPQEYFERLQRLGRGKRSLFVVAEKILSGDELLRSDWPVDGSTGYDFLNQLNGLFVNSANEAIFSRVYEEVTGCSPNFPASAEASKRKVIDTSFRSEIRSLTQRLAAIAAGHNMNISAEDLQQAIRELIVAFPVYRTYISRGSGGPNAEDRLVISEAIRKARLTFGNAGSEALKFLHDVLLLRLPREEMREAAVEFAMKFQQLTGPAMAKGLEDTCFYNYNRLVSLNEVGGEPGHFGNSIEQFHQHNRIKSQHWPHSLLATATHDTKRGEDLRARINVLSEIPDEWLSCVRRWKQLNGRHKQAAGQTSAPHPNDEYLLYQTLVGAWPWQSPDAAAKTQQEEAFRDRIAEYMLKATREAKQHTTWTEQNAAYEDAVKEFIARILHPNNGAFVADLLDLRRRVAFFGQFNSYSQILLKMTSPGVPDFYQGTELWDFSLVDPDNRRPVDYEVRKRTLAILSTKRDGQRSQIMRELLNTPENGALKLFITTETLRFRRNNPQLFQRGNYQPLECRGTKANHVVAFAREWEAQQVIVIAPRLIVGLTGGKEVPPIGPSVWQNTTLATGRGGTFRDVFTGYIINTSGSEQGIAISEVLSRAPVALLERVAA